MGRSGCDFDLHLSTGRQLQLPPSARSSIAEGAHGAPLAPHKLPRRAPSRRSVVAHEEAIGTLRRTSLKEGVFGACGLAPTVSMEGMSKIKRTVRRGHH
ncbi:hypothetical protein F5144DRAFT_572720 [Chaetomium tenue]|uniref:Uncharacterized protein n=1 Tax=Chaetomium tenue TaxID=1854479 RepID=A0ACB7PA28_9PEZI|nr:hypothetical protein F5144DRAFT_572720 [Chaetomium globosum]